MCGESYDSCNEDVVMLLSRYFGSCVVKID